MNAPALHSRVLITEALEWNPDFNLVAALDQLPLRLEEVIGIQIDAPLERIDRPKSAAGCRRTARSPRELCAPCSVLLNAVGIYAEQKRDLTRVVGIEEDLNLILAVDVVAIGVGGAHDVTVDFAGLDAEVDRVAGVKCQNLGRLDRRQPIHGLILREASESRSSPPRSIVEITVDLDNGIDSWDFDVDALRSTVVDDRRVL